MNVVYCCILGCKCREILAHCKSCKIYFCYNHRTLIDSHEIVPSFSIYDNYYCCNYCCNKHFYVRCNICDDMIINTNVRYKKDGSNYCIFPCYKY